MTKDQARALCQLMHIQFGESRGYAFYATAALFGHDLSSTSELAEVAWEHKFNRDTMTKKAAAFFRDLADALENEK